MLRHAFSFDERLRSEPATRYARRAARYVSIRPHTSAYLPLAKRVARLVEEEEGKVVHLRARMHEALSY